MPYYMYVNRRIFKLYRQMMEGAESIRVMLDNEGEREPKSKLLRKIYLNNIEDFNSNKIQIEKDIEKLSSKIDPQIVTPILMECYARAYYDPRWEGHRDLGLAFKVAISSIIYHGLSKSSSLSKSYRDIFNLVLLCSLYIKIMPMSDIFMFYPNGIEIIVDPFKIQANELGSFYLMQYTLAFQKKGRALRTISATDAILSRGLPNALHDCLYVLSGRNPGDIKAYSGTLFSKIDKNSDFWLGLVSRLLTAHLSAKHRGEFDEGVLYTSIFNSSAVNLKTTLDFDAIRLQNYIRERVFWNKQWYTRRYKTSPHSMIVERPILRIYDIDDIYCTSRVAAIESIKSYVEASVLAYPDWNGDKTDESIFRDFISEPFETRVIRSFRKYGFQAGIINEKGVWQNEKGNFKLSNEDNEMPGEVDLFAIHVGKKILIVGDCKVISWPSPGSRMKSVIDKLGPGDSEKFHAKLQKKMEWILKTREFHNMTEYETHSFIFIDLPLPGMINKQFKSDNNTPLSPVIYEEILEKLIHNLVEE